MCKSLLVASTCLFALLACKNGTLETAGTGQEVPALISQPGPESRAELQSVVSEALAGVELLLADNVLSEDSVLIMERQARRDPSGNRLPGRVLSEPEKFQLLLSGKRCILLQQSTGKRWELQKTRCVPE